MFFFSLKKFEILIEITWNYLTSPPILHWRGMFLIIAFLKTLKSKWMVLCNSFGDKIRVHIICLGTGESVSHHLVISILNSVTFFSQRASLKRWTFKYLLFFTGYGHIAPATTVGRIITIIYSLFGIPLFLILLADYGKLFTRMIKFFWAYVRRLYYTGSCRKVRKTVPVQVNI